MNFRHSIGMWIGVRSPLNELVGGNYIRMGFVIGNRSKSFYCPEMYDGLFIIEQKQQEQQDTFHDVSNTTFTCLRYQVVAGTSLGARSPVPPLNAQVIEALRKKFDIQTWEMETWIL